MRRPAADLEDLERKINELTAAVIMQSPNFFGVVEDVRRAAEIAHRRGALLVMGFTEAVSLGILEPPPRPISSPASCSPSPSRPATADRMRASSPRARSSFGRCRAGWSARRRIRMAIARFA